MQFGEPFAHGVAMVPFVTSLKTQVAAGPVVELQPVAVCMAASLYRTKLALPCRDPVC